MPLAITGQESVWYRVWTKLGLTDEEIRNYSRLAHCLGIVCQPGLLAKISA